MFKHLSRGLSATLALAILTSCASANYSQMQMPMGNQQLARPGMLTAQNAATPRNGDWFAALRPELQTYYATARGKTGPALFTALNQIISRNQKTMAYGPAKSHMYAVVDQVKVNNTPGLFDAYSYAFIPGTGGNGNIYTERSDENQDGTPGDFINCEHTWPQSFFKEQMPMVSDIHHMFPTLSKPNAMRSNYPIGMATGVVVYNTNGSRTDGSKLGVIDPSGRYSPDQIRKWFNTPYQQQPHDILKTLQVTFEPDARQKGNTARALLYFYLRYNQENIYQGAFNRQAFLDSKVSTWMRWAEAEDPVDAQEVRRHELVFQQQGNRNPFVDIPNLPSLLGQQAFAAR